MSKFKGVVMRVAGKKTIVYTQDGDFLQIATPSQIPVVGQIIEFDAKSRSFFASNAWLKYATTAAVLILILTMGFMYPFLWPLDGAVASVELNINNGMSLQLDKEGKVTNVYSTGSESNGVDSGLALKGLDVYQAVKLIVEDAGQKGDFNHEQSVVMVSVVPVEKKGEDAVDPDKLRDIVHEEMLKQNASGMVLVGKLSREDGNKAQSMGMQVNNYLIYERCRKDGLEVQPDVFRQRNIRDAMKEINVSLSNLFPGEYLEVTGHSNNNGNNKQDRNADGIMPNNNRDRNKHDHKKQDHNKKENNSKFNSNNPGSDKKEDKQNRENKLNKDGIKAGEEVIVRSESETQEKKHGPEVKESKRIQPGSRSSFQLSGHQVEVNLYKDLKKENMKKETGKKWPPSIKPGNAGKEELKNVTGKHRNNNVSSNAAHRNGQPNGKIMEKNKRNNQKK